MDPLKNLECILLQCSLSGHQDPSIYNQGIKRYKYVIKPTHQVKVKLTQLQVTVNSIEIIYANKSGLILIIFVTAKESLLSQVSILTGQNIGKEVNLSLCNFQFMNMIVCYKDTNLRFTGDNLVVCSRMRVCMTCQHDR